MIVDRADWRVYEDGADFYINSYKILGMNKFIKKSIYKEI